MGKLLMGLFYWFGVRRTKGSGNRDQKDPPVKERALPDIKIETWRTWLVPSFPCSLIPVLCSLFAVPCL
jgi:hypothetical protein